MKDTTQALLFMMGTLRMLQKKLFEQRFPTVVRYKQETYDLFFREFQGTDEACGHIYTAMMHLESAYKVLNASTEVSHAKS